MLNAIMGGIGLTFLVSDWIYHRMNEPKPVEKKMPTELPIPRTDEGAPMPLLLGRTLVRQPFLAWAYCQNLNFNGGGDAVSANMLMMFAIAIGCDDGNGKNRVHGIYIGDDATSTGWTQTGSGLETQAVPGFGDIETLNGNPAQVIANPGDTDFPGAQPAPTWAGRRMRNASVNVPVADIGSYRGYVCAFLHQIGSGWLVGVGSSASYAFEASSHHTAHAQLSTYNQVGLDMNPINAIYLLLVQKFGALGIDPARIDIASFQAAQYTVRTESMGYSSCIADPRSGDEHIQEILRLVDAAVDEDPTDGKLKIQLVRPDYNPNTIPHITRDNCERLVNFVAGSWADVVNRMRLVFTDRANKYQDGSVADGNTANSTAQDADEEQMIEMRGIHDRDLAKRVLKRELWATSRPLMKFRAMCGRWAIRLMRGQAVKVTWTNPDVAGLVFRVADVDRGSLEDGPVAVDLVQDFYYTYRRDNPVGPADIETDIPGDFDIGG